METSPVHVGNACPGSNVWTQHVFARSGGTLKFWNSCRDCFGAPWELAFWLHICMTCEEIQTNLLQRNSTKQVPWTIGISIGPVVWCCNASISSTFLLKLLSSWSKEKSGTQIHRPKVAIWVKHGQMMLLPIMDGAMMVLFYKAIMDRTFKARKSVPALRSLSSAGWWPMSEIYHALST